MHKKPTIIALVMAAGLSSRFADKIPKPYVMARHKPVLKWSIDKLHSIPTISGITVVISASDLEYFKNLKLSPDVSYCFGGQSRQESVRLGLDAILKYNPDFVLIHDAARPNVEPDDIATLIDHAVANPECGFALGKKMRDSMHRADQNDNAKTSIDRDNLWAIETPQIFSYDRIVTAHRKMAGKVFTDDIGVYVAAGHNAQFIESKGDNFKITLPQCLKRFETMQNHVSRTGFGYDIHRLGDGESITLGGIVIPHNQSLIGHSDADVVLHALTDALLGTCGGGDIGVHFPPSEQKWKAAKSDIFVRHACEMVSSHGGKIGNVDITILAEAPKILPHRMAMQNHIASLLNIKPESVNIKATTHEGIGAIGRGEGIAAHAVATVFYPQKEAL